MNKNKHKIIAVIPARGGSKSVPCKNIRMFGGKPLLAHMLEAAFASKYLTHIALSSEDEEILDVAKKHGGGNLILIKRPKHLATDKATSLPVVQHAVKKIEKEIGEKFDYIVMLQVTTPFTTSSDIDGVLDQLINTEADSAVGVYQVNDMHPVKMKKIVSGKLVQYVDDLEETVFRRQDFEPVYKRNGGVRAATREVIMDQNLFFCGKVVKPYIVPKERSIEIDDETDFLLAKLLYENESTN
ncbi:MAG: acylneuraminate cytidylyltransferase family protein [Patescibacteria group bacterium]